MEIAEKADWDIANVIQMKMPMDEGRERDNTSRRGGLPTLPSL
jgi:hypothetical protein